MAAAIVVGRVEVVDSQIERFFERFESLVFFLVLQEAAAAAEAENRNAHAGAGEDASRKSSLAIRRDCSGGETGGGGSEKMSTGNAHMFFLRGPAIFTSSGRKAA